MLLPSEQCYPSKPAPGCLTQAIPLTATLLRLIPGDSRTRTAPLQLEPATAEDVSGKCLALSVRTETEGFPTQEVVVCTGDAGQFRSDFYVDFLGEGSCISVVAYALPSKLNVLGDGHVSLTGASIVGRGLMEAVAFDSGGSLGTVKCSLFAGDKVVGAASWEYVKVTPLLQQFEVHDTGESDARSITTLKGSVVTLADDALPDAKSQKHVPPLFAGHRGLGACAETENTLESFRKATAGRIVKAVELDAQVSEEGVVLVHHDWKIDGEFVYHIEHEKENSRLLTLEEVCRGLPADVSILCDIKVPPPNVKAKYGIPMPDLNYTADQIVSSLLAQRVQRPVALLAFDADLCVMLSLKQTAYPVYLLHCEELDGPECDDADPRMVCVERGLKFATAQKLTGMCLYSPLIKRDGSLPQRVAATGMSVMSYGADVDAALDQLQNLGVQGVIVDQVLPVAAAVSKSLAAAEGSECRC